MRHYQTLFDHFLPYLGINGILLVKYGKIGQCSTNIIRPPAQLFMFVTYNIQFIILVLDTSCTMFLKHDSRDKHDVLLGGWF